MDALPTLIDAELSIEKTRVRTQVRNTHLAKAGRVDPETEWLLGKLQDLEDNISDRVAGIVEIHPAHPWFGQVRGIGKENIGKVIGLIDITKADTISSLWKFAGYDVQNGKAPKRIRGGGTLTYNSRLRTMCWRLGSSLMRSKGSFYDYYERQKRRLYDRADLLIIPTTELPKENGKRFEPAGVMSEGHAHAYALRKMIKLFLSCLWLVWREAEGLPTSKPYAIDQLKHDSFIGPWEMVDRK